jgi:acyl-CoA reductase-like NAD-dependent aldehyde dehydrogenase
MNHPAPDWHAAATNLRIDGRAVIAGRRCAALSGQTFESNSPLDGRKLGDVARGQSADVDAAVASARQAFDDGRWAHQAPAARKKVLQRFAEKILAAKDELALLETLDMGKPIRYSLSVDVAATARCIAWYAEAVDKVYDEIAPTSRSALALIQREPMGVIGAIVPWNYPMIMAAWKLGPALAAGNSVVLKPSEKSPLTALRLAELALDADLPEGVFNVIPGYGHEAGEALALHLDVDAIGFTGSTRVGRKMLEYAGRSNLKRVYNELGGKSAFLVFNDFADVPPSSL